MEKIDLAKLTKDAEDLKGCSIMDAFDGLPLQEQLAVMREIHVLNAEHHANDKSLPEISVKYFIDGGGLGDSKIQMRVDKINPGSLKTSLFSGTIDIGRAERDGKVRYNCTDIADTKIVSRSKETKF